jgi:hypothetical protein
VQGSRGKISKAQRTTEYGWRVDSLKGEGLKCKMVAEGVSAMMGRWINSEQPGFNESQTHTAPPDHDLTFKESFPNRYAST